MSIGAGWADGAWIDAGWVVGAWSQLTEEEVVARNRPFIANVGTLMGR